MIVKEYACRVHAQKRLMVAHRMLRASFISILYVKCPLPALDTLYFCCSSGIKTFLNLKEITSRVPGKDLVAYRKRCEVTCISSCCFVHSKTVDRPLIRGILFFVVMTSLNGHMNAPMDGALDRMLDDACADVLGLQPPVVGPSARPEEFFIGEIDVADTSHTHLGTSHSSNALLMEDLDDNSLLAPEADAPELMLGTSAPAVLQGFRWVGFPAIPEHAELQMAPLHHSGAFPRSLSQPTFIPMTSNGPEELRAYIPGTIPCAVEHSGAHASSPTESTTSSGAPLSSSPGGAGVPRVASMPNLSLAATAGSNLHNALLRRNAAAAAASPGGRSGIPRSRSANDVTGLNRYVVPHSEFLTPPHLRKGKGGRQPAGDPRLDPRIDPKKAKRILANRLSAAKSKLKQKSAADGLKQRVEMLRLQREGLATEVTSLAEACAVKEAEREALLRQLHAAEEALMNGKAPFPSLGSSGAAGLVT